MAEYLRELVVKDDLGNDRSLNDLLQRVTLIVNVDCKVGGDANSACANLQSLYDKYKSLGFEILAFPCDQFQIANNRFCTASEVKQDLVKRYGVTFPVLNRVNVNGETAHPLFVFLQKRLTGFPTDAIKWDFTKFLVVDGEPRTRYAPTTPAKMVEADIAQELGVPLPAEEIASGSSIKQGLQTIYEQGKIETGKVQETIKHGLQAIGISKPSGSNESTSFPRPEELDRQQMGQSPDVQSSNFGSEPRSELQSPFMSRQQVPPSLERDEPSIGSRSEDLQSRPQGSEWDRSNTDTIPQDIEKPQTVRVTEIVRQVELADSESAPGTSASQESRNYEAGGMQQSTTENQSQPSNLRVTSRPQATMPELPRSAGHVDSADRI